MFGNFAGGSAALTYPDPAPPPAAVTLGTVVRAAWAEFAHTGNPGWAPFTADHDATQIFDTTPRVTSYTEHASARLWCQERFECLDIPRP